MTRQLEFALGEGVRDGPTVIRLCGAALLADVSGALYWPERRTLIVSDLHLEQGAASAARGWLLPPYDTTATLTLLEGVVARYRVDRVIALGDNFHSVEAANRIDARTAARLAALQDGRDWDWVTGNHDPELPRRLGGRVRPSVTLGPLRFRHEPLSGPSVREIAGHLHPAAKLRRRGASVRRKCFVSDGTRLVMPAFGAYTGGLNVLAAPFRSVFGRREVLVWMLGRDAVYPVSARQLYAD